MNWQARRQASTQQRPQQTSTEDERDRRRLPAQLSYPLAFFLTKNMRHTHMRHHTPSDGTPKAPSPAGPCKPPQPCRHVLAAAQEPRGAPRAAGRQGGHGTKRRHGQLVGFCQRAHLLQRKKCGRGGGSFS